MPKPTIAMIRGFCMGGGIELASALDIRIAGDDARFGVPPARISVVAGYEEARRLIALCGRGEVARILLTAEAIDAREALRIGLVTKVVEAGLLDEEVYTLARNVARLAPLSHLAHKAVIRKVLEDPGLENLTEEEEALPFAVFDSDDFREGRAAFLEKRRPEFRGR
jgi:enoyl-CoA hydratase/carnithine racemase